jgi:Tol biopolymer transport system component
MYFHKSYPLFFLLLVIVFSCKLGEPLPIDYHNKILFTSSLSGKEQLYMMNPDGKDMIQITSGQYWHNNGRWSPDAKKIVCNTEEGTTTAGFEMVVMDSDGNNRKLLGWGNQMTWHPDGDIIVFSYWQGAELGIYNNKLYSIKTNGENRQIISENYVGSHSFSPDGDKIVFSKSDSSKQIVIVEYPSFNNPTYIGPINGGGYPSWSPSGKKIAFSFTDSTSIIDGLLLSNIYLMNIDGTDIIKLTNHSTKEHYSFPRWSPDSEKVIFLGIGLDDTESTYLYIVNNDGTNLHKIIDGNSITSCDWSK